MRSAKERVFQLFSNPDRAHQEIEEALKEGGLVSFDAMTGEEQNPASDEQWESDAPPGDAHHDDARDNERNSDGMHHLVPRIGVLVIVLSHVLV